MNAPITLFEHESQQFPWTDRHLVLLERLRRSLGAEVLRATMLRGARVLQAAQYVGVVRMGSQTVQILPKIYRTVEASDKQQAREATHNLLHLLGYAGQFSLREHEVAALFQHESDWFEILTRLFATHLTEEWQHGPIRSYQTVEEELPLLKGKWLIAQQLRRPERRQVFAVAYDEFTSDNRLNRVFRYVVERLWRLTLDANNRRLLGDLRQWMDEVTLLPTIQVHDADTALLTRLNQRYLPMLNLARLFLDGGALQLTVGDEANFAFVFDMNRLFESFIASFISRHRDAILPDDLQECDLLPQSKQVARHLAHTDGKAVFRLEPDLVFRQGGQFPILIDTKYKQLDITDIALGIAQSDFYQMYAYARRYNCAHVMLLYPQTAGMPLPLYRCFVLADDPAKTIVATTIDIRKDLGKSDERRALVESLRIILHTGSTYGEPGQRMAI